MATPSVTAESFLVPELDCPDELALIRQALGVLPGVETIEADYFARRLRVEFDHRQTDRDAVLAAIRRTGLAAHLDVPRQTGAAEDGPTHAARLRVGSVLAAGVLIAIALIARLAAERATPLVAATATAATLLAAAPIARSAWRSLRLRVLDINVLMVLAAGGALVIGEHLEAATAMFLFNVALWVERRSMERARRTVRSLVELSPRIAHRLNADGPVDVEAESLQVGQRVLVRPGERIPVDGVVRKGLSAVNQAPITGESVPVEKEPGESVFAGSLNGEGSLEVETQRASQDTTLAHIARLIAQAQASRSPTERLVDRFARRYTPAVIALALVVAFGPPLLVGLGVSAAWLESADAVGWFHRGLVLLVISCPCALVISTPVTVVSALYRAARRGILVKGGEHLDGAARVDAVALDKTGTLTVGSPTVVGLETCAGHSADQVLRVAAILERHSEHPLAEAIVAAAVEHGLDLADETLTDFAALRGFGVQGTLQGQTLLVGSPRLFAERARSGETDVLERWRREGHTLAVVGTPDALWGAIRLADPVRPGAAEAIAKLRRLGVRPIVMLTGDSRAVADGVARELGLDEVYADLLPEDKVRCTQRLAERCPNLAMVGDGVNDAPALAASSLGIAMGSKASDTALETADVVIMAPDLGRIGELIRLGRRCHRVLLQNITLALAAKGVVLLLAAAGLATMWMAVAADMGASLLVTSNGLRLAAGDRR